MGLCPPGGVALDGGGRYEPSTLQRKVWSLWRAFWDEWVPQATKGEPFIVVHNGDALDGVHHNATTQISHNLADQANIAYECLAPCVARAQSYYHVRGTEAHVGPSGAEEERLAQRLGAVIGSEGESARWELWLELHGHLGHFSHHMGVTGSVAYEPTAFGREMAEALVEAGLSGQRPPEPLVRGHRHRGGQWSKGSVSMIATPSFQLKTPYSHRLPMGRVAQPEIGGGLVRVGDDDQLYALLKIWRMERPQAVKIGEQGA